MKSFDPLGFAAQLLVIKRNLASHTEAGLKKACVVLQRDMEGQIGQYQEEVGQFPAWAPLAESTEADKAAHGYPADAPLLRTGGLQGSFGHEVDGNKAVVGSKDPTMVFHEFGTSKMPPRPVVGPAVFRNHDRVKDIIGHAVVEGIVEGQLLTGLGSDHFGDEI